MAPDLIFDGVYFGKHQRVAEGNTCGTFSVVSGWKSRNGISCNNYYRVVPTRGDEKFVQCTNVIREDSGNENLRDKIGNEYL